VTHNKQQNFNAIASIVNGNLDTTNIDPAFLFGTGRFVLESVIGVGGGALPPIGTVLPWDDFNGKVSFNSTYYKLCDGTVINSPSSPINGDLTRDMSNLYLVGYGTINGGDIGTAPYNAAQTGNSSHQINILHSHTISAHSHVVDPHTHSSGTLQFNTLTKDASGSLLAYNIGGLSVAIHNTRFLIAGAGALELFERGAGAATYYTSNGTGSTGSNSPNTDAVALSTNNQLSATQNIQPRSTRVRYIVRIL